MEHTANRKDVIALILISGAVLLWNLWTGSLCSWDEGFYAGVSREILRTGKWIDLYWSGMPWSDKPPLYMWATAGAFKLFGVNEFSVRLFSALCGIGTVLVTYLFALKLYSRKAAVAAALFLLSTWHFIRFSKMGTLDVALTFFTALSLYLFVLGEEKRPCLFFSAVSFALAFLTKGFGALLIPLILGVYVILSGKWKVLKEPALLFGLAVSIILVGWWHWTVYLRYGDSFIQDYIVKHLFTRTTTTLDGHTGDIFFYIGVVPNKGRPWAVIGLALLPLAVWRIFARGEKEHLLPVIWAGVVLLLFSMVRTKLHWYIMPLYPALSMTAGWAAARALKRYTIPVVCLAAAIALTYLTVDKKIFDLDHSPGIKLISLEARRTVPDGEKVYLYDISDPDMQFYMGGVGVNISNEEKFLEVREMRGVFVLVNKRSLGRFSGIPHETVLDRGDYIVLKTR